MDQTRVSSTGLSFQQLVRLEWYDTTVVGTNETAALAMPGLVALGAIVPFALGLFVAAASTFSGDYDLVGTAALIGCLAGASVGPIAMLVAFWISSSLVATLNFTLGFPYKARTQLAIVGGLAAFIPAACVCISFGRLDWRELFAFGVCSGAALICGQQMAIWFGRRELSCDRFTTQVRTMRRTGLQLQFRLTQLFSIVSVLAVYLAVDRLLSFRMTQMAVIFCVLQSIAWAADRIFITFVRHFWA